MYVLHSRAFFIWQTFLLGLLVQARYYILRFFWVVYFDAETDVSDLQTCYFTLRILWTTFFQVVCLYRCLLLVGYYIPQLRYRCQWPMAQMTQSHELPYTSSTATQVHWYQKNRRFDRLCYYSFTWTQGSCCSHSSMPNGWPFLWLNLYIMSSMSSRLLGIYVFFSTLLIFPTPAYASIVLQTFLWGELGSPFYLAFCRISWDGW